MSPRPSRPGGWSVNTLRSQSWEAGVAGAERVRGWGKVREMQGLPGSHLDVEGHCADSDPPVL